MHWRKISLVGIGLLGGSLGLAIKQRRLAERVTGYVRRHASLQECQSRGVADQVTMDLNEAVEGADLIILCTPIGEMAGLLRRMGPRISPSTIITDVGSVKKRVVDELEPLAAEAGAAFVGSHPMSGGEKMGVSAARSDLFENATCVITPSEKTDAEALARVEAFWQAAGTRTLRLSAELHDALVGRSSHLIHIAAAALAKYVLGPQHPEEQALLCSTGFRDTTRIASGSPGMWRDITLANRENLLEHLGALITELAGFREQLERGDGPAIQTFFELAKQQRDEWQRLSSDASGNHLAGEEEAKT